MLENVSGHNVLAAMGGALVVAWSSLAAVHLTVPDEETRKASLVEQSLQLSSDRCDTGADQAKILGPVFKAAAPEALETLATNKIAVCVLDQLSGQDNIQAVYYGGENILAVKNSAEKSQYPAMFVDFLAYEKKFHPEKLQGPFYYASHVGGQSNVAQWHAGDFKTAPLSDKPQLQQSPAKRKI